MDTGIDLECFVAAIAQRGDQLSLAGDSLEVVRNSAAITILSPTV